MGDMVRVPSSDNSNKMPKERLTKAYSGIPPSIAPNKVYKHLSSQRLGGISGQLMMFLLKVAALEIVRRSSRSKCPFLWHALQSIQVLIYPPFKWIQRWRPMGILLKGIQAVSRPLMLLSVVTAFSDHLESQKKISTSNDDFSPSPSTTNQETSEARTTDGTSQSDFYNLLMQLSKELQEDGVIFPERINDVEIQNFYTATNGDYSFLKQSLRKTIRWRESYKILSPQELDAWSQLVFWHGRDVDGQPCLIVRLGLAFSSLAPRDRPNFVQAVVSQLEDGVLRLVNDDHRITALVDCSGLAAIRFPMHMLRSCSTLLQDHYPNRLAALLVTRLPPSTLAITHSFIQNLKPETRKKVRIWGETYPDVLLEFLQSVPAFLGGSCTCSKCYDLRPSSQVFTGESSRSKLNRATSNGGFKQTQVDSTEISYGSNCEQVIRTAVFGLLMLWIFLAFFVGMQDPDGFSIS